MGGICIRKKRVHARDQSIDIGGHMLCAVVLCQAKPENRRRHADDGLDSDDLRGLTVG